MPTQLLIKAAPHMLSLIIGLKNIKISTLLLLLSSSMVLLSTWRQPVSCSRNSHRHSNHDLTAMEAKEVTLPIIERFYLLVKYHEPICGFEDTEVPKPVCWSDKASFKVTFNHTRLLANALTFCNGSLLQLPDSIYKAMEGHSIEVFNSPISHLNAIALVDGVASVPLIKGLDNTVGTGNKMKYDAQMILDDILYRAASDKSIEFFSKYKEHSHYYLHRPKFTDLITRLNVYLSTNNYDKVTFLELPKRLTSEMRYQANHLMSIFQNPDQDLTLINMLKSFGLGESDFASLKKPIYLETCTHESDRQLITMDFVHRSSQKFTYLLPYNPKITHSDPIDKIIASQKARESSENEESKESIFDLAKRRLLDTIGAVYT